MHAYFSLAFLFFLFRLFLTLVLFNHIPSYNMPTSFVPMTSTCVTWSDFMVVLSQATLHHGILHMAGQLGLDPPTMTLCNGGVISELEQALLNSEAIANSFGCSISSSAISFVVYCSRQTVSLDMTELQYKWEEFMEQFNKLHSAKRSTLFDPILLFVLVPELPKRYFPYFLDYPTFLFWVFCLVIPFSFSFDIHHGFWYMPCLLLLLC